MSFAGHVLDMVKRQKMNRALQKKNRQNYSDKLSNLIDTSSRTKIFNQEKFGTISAHQQAVNKLTIQETLRKERLRATLYAILVVGLLFFLSWSFFSQAIF